MSMHRLKQVENKILMVDDDPRALSGYERNLSRLFALETAQSAEDGLRLIAECGPFAVVISDLRMPGMNGMEFLKRVREDSGSTVAMLLSGCLDLIDSMKIANEANVTHYLVKPCSREDLIAAITSALAEHKQAISGNRDIPAITESTIGGGIQQLLTVARGLSSQIKQVTALEAKTVAGELSVLALMRELLSPAAVFGQPVATSYRRSGYKTRAFSEEWTYLPEGFPVEEGANNLLALPAIDGSTAEEIQFRKDGEGASDQYICDCLYLLKDRRWLLVERVGTRAEGVGSSCGFDAKCKIVTDRTLIGRFPISRIAEGLLASANGLVQTLGSRADQLHQRSSAASHYAAKLSPMAER